MPASKESSEKIIHSLLLSTKGETSLTKLKFEYKEELGVEIPFAQFGFTNLETFISSLKTIDTRRTYDGTLLLLPKGNEAVNHIKKLVDQQKSSVPKRKYMSGGYSGRRPNYSSAARPNYSLTGWNNYSSAGWNNYSAGNTEYYRKTYDYSVRKPDYAARNFEHVKKLIQPLINLPVTKENLLPGAVRRIELILKKYKAGLVASEIIKYYQDYKDYESELNWSKMGYRSLDDLLSTAPAGTFSTKLGQKGLIYYPPFHKNNGSFREEKWEVCSNVNVEPKTLNTSPSIQNINELEDSKSRMQTQTPSVDVDDFDQRVTGDEVFSTLDLDELLSNDKKLPVQAGEVYSPELFWLVPAIDGTLEDMYQKLQLFYTDDILKRWVIAPEDVIMEQPVVIKYKDGFLYRAVITKTNDFESYVQIFCVDYGTVCEAEKDQLWYLHKEFMSLPSQAFMASLDGIRPTDSSGKWTKDTSHRLLELVEGKLFLADFKSRNSTSTSVILTEKSATTEPSINDILVQEGYVAHQSSSDEELSLALNEISINSATPPYQNGFVYSSNDSPSPTISNSSLASVKEPTMMRTRNEVIIHIQAAIKLLMVERTSLIAELKKKPDEDAVLQDVLYLYNNINSLKKIEVDLKTNLDEQMQRDTNL